MNEHCDRGDRWSCGSAAGIVRVEIAVGRVRRRLRVAGLTAIDGEEFRKARRSEFQRSTLEAFVPSPSLSPRLDESASPVPSCSSLETDLLSHAVEDPREVEAGDHRARWRDMVEYCVSWTSNIVAGSPRSITIPDSESKWTHCDIAVIIRVCGCLD